MKKIILVLPLIIACSITLFPQWSTDPNNNLVIAVGWDPHIVSDSAGGCYITYNYDSFYPQKLAVERLDKYGYKPWGDKKQILGELPEQWQAEIIEDGEGGVIVSYEDNQVVGTDFTSRVRVQKVDSSGNFLWEQTGVHPTVVDTNHGLINLVSDGEGGCVILWQEYEGNYYLNRLNSLGQRVWGDSGIFIGTGNYSRSEIINATDGNYYVETGEYIYRIRQNGEFTLWNSSNDWWLIVAAPEGGGILHSAIWSPSCYTLLAQRKDTLGNNLWQEPYVEIADSLYINTPINIQQIDGYYYYYWYGTKGGIDLVTQYQALRSDGSKLFNQGSQPISSYPVDALIGGILPSDSGTVILVWEDFRPDDGVFGQRKDTLGNSLWNLNDVSLYTGMYADLSAITDCAGGAIGLGWHQFDFTFRAFKISKNGVLGEVITNIDNEYKLTHPEELILYQNFPNPYNSSTTIQFHLLTERKISIDLYNVLGEKMKTIANGVYPQGTNSVQLSSYDLPSGIYLYKLQTETGSLTKKLIIIK